MLASRRYPACQFPSQPRHPTTNDGCERTKVAQLSDDLPSDGSGALPALPSRALSVNYDTERALIYAITNPGDRIERAQNPTGDAEARWAQLSQRCEMLRCGAGP